MKKILATVLLIFVFFLSSPLNLSTERAWHPLPSALAGPFRIDTLGPSNPPVWFEEALDGAKGKPESWARNMCKIKEAGSLALNERCEWLARMAKIVYTPALARVGSQHRRLERGSWENARAVCMPYEQVYWQALERETKAYFDTAIKEVGLVITPPGKGQKVFRMKMCGYAHFKVQAYWVIGDTTYYSDIRSSAVKWAFSDAQSLIPYEGQVVKVDDENAKVAGRARISGETFSTYMANKPGTYMLMASAPQTESWSGETGQVHKWGN